MSLRPLMRLSWRNVGRMPLRHALIVAMIGLPVAALSAGLVVVRADAEQTRQLDRFETAGGDLILGSSGAPPEAPPELATFPRQEVRTGLWATGDARRAELRAWREMPATLLGTLPLVEGRLPRRPGEVLANRSDPGDLRGASATGPTLPSMRWKIVGWFHLGGADSIVALPGTFPPSEDPSWRDHGFDPPRHLALLELGREPTASELSAAGSAADLEVLVSPRHSSSDTSLSTELAVVAGSVVAFLWCGLLAASALAISARHRQREAVLLATQGATPRVLRARLLADAVLLGAVGATGGLALGLALVGGVERWVPPNWPRVDLTEHIGPLVAVAPLLGLCSATIAGWAVSRTAMRRPLADQLTCSDPPPAAAGRLAATGVVGAGSAAALAWWLSPGTAGPVATVVGSALMVVSGVLAVVSLSGALLRALPGWVSGMGVGARVASRQLHRLGVRATAASGALALTCSAALLLGAVGEWSKVGGADRGDRPPQVPPSPKDGPLRVHASKTSLIIREDRLVWMGELSPDELAAIDAVFGGHATVLQRRVVERSDLAACSAGRCDPSPFVSTQGWASGLPEGLRRHLATGGFVVLGATDGDATVRIGSTEAAARVADRDAVGRLAEGGAGQLLDSIGWSGTLVLVPDQRWEEVTGGRTPTSEVVISVPRDAPLDPGTVRSGLAALGRADLSFWSEEATDLLPRTDQAGGWLGLAVGAGSAVIALLVLWTALGLVRLETRREEWTLFAHGAVPVQRAAIAGWRAALCTVAAALPAATVTTVVLSCLTRATDGLVGAAPPGWYVAALIGAPLVAGAVFLPGGLVRLRSGPGDLSSLTV